MDNRQRWKEIIYLVGAIATIVGVIWGMFTFFYRPGTTTSDRGTPVPTYQPNYTPLPCGAAGLACFITPTPTLVDTPTASPTALATDIPSPTNTPTPPPPHTLLYKADWSKGMAGWTSSSTGWTVGSGMLVNDGTSHVYGGGAFILAPPQTWGTSNYEVVVSLEIPMRPYSPGSFGILARGDGKDYAGLIAEVANVGKSTYPPYASPLAEIFAYNGGSGNIQGVTFQPDATWHTYTFEVNGNTVTFLLDGNVIASGTNNSFLTDQGIGLEADGIQVSIRDFEVYTL